MNNMNNVAVFWDYENCRPPSNMAGHEVVSKIRKVVASLGRIKLFRAYLDVLLDSRSTKSQSTHSELHLSGVALVHCPHYGWNRKDVADKTMLVDIMSLAHDWSPPATIVLISGDRDFSYAMATLGFQGYDVVVISPSDCTHASLKALASHTYDWYTEVLEVAPQGGEHHAACDHARLHSRESVSNGNAASALNGAAYSCCDAAVQPLSSPAGRGETTEFGGFNAEPLGTSAYNGTHGFTSSGSPGMAGAEREGVAFVTDRPRAAAPQNDEFNRAGTHTGTRENIGVDSPRSVSVPLTPRRVAAPAFDNVAADEAPDAVSNAELSRIQATQNRDRVQQAETRESIPSFHPLSSISSTPVDPLDANNRKGAQEEEESDGQGSESTSSSSLSPSNSSSEPSPVSVRQTRLTTMEEMSSYDAARSRTTTDTPTLLNGSVEYGPSHSFDALRKLDMFMSELQANSSLYRADQNEGDDDVGIRVTAIPEVSPSDPFADPEPYVAEDMLYGASSRPNVYSREASVYGEADNHDDFDHDGKSSSRPDSPEYVSTQRNIEEVYFLPSKSVDVPSLPVDIPLSSDEEGTYESVQMSNQAIAASKPDIVGNLNTFAERLQQTRCASEPPSLHAEDKRVQQDDAAATMSEYTGDITQYSVAPESWQWVSTRANAGGVMDRGVSELNGFTHARMHITDQGYDKDRTPVSRVDVLGSVPSARSSSVSFHSVRSGSSEFGNMSQKAAGKRPAVSLGIPTLSSNSYDSTATEIVSAATETVLDWRQTLRDGASQLGGNAQVPAPVKDVPPLCVPGKVTSAAPSVVSSTAPSIPSTLARPQSVASYAQSSQSASSPSVIANINKFRPMVDILRQESSKNPPTAMMASSLLGSKLLQRDVKVYTKVGVSKLKLYLAMAKDAGVIEFVGKQKGGDTFVALTQDYISDPPAPQSQSQSVVYPIAATAVNIFTPLISSMKQLSPSGHVLASALGEFLARHRKGAYEQAGAKNFTQYIGMAEKAGVVRYQGETPHPKRWVVYGENASKYGAK